MIKAAFGDTIEIGSKVQWLGVRGGVRRGTVIDISPETVTFGQHLAAKANIRTTKGNWAWVPVTRLVVLP
jgi:hypothetical protein